MYSSDKDFCFILTQVYKQHKVEWKPILEEAVKFCNVSKNVITGTNAKHLHLVGLSYALCDCQ